MKKITLSEVNQKRLRIVGYLLASGILGYVLATYVANNEALAVVFAPAINFILYSVTEELKGEGYVKALK
jgi:hypothetical protein